MQPKYPIYIPSKGRADTRYTSKALDKMGVPYKIIVEESEYDNYVKEVGKEKILILDKKYQEKYDTCDTLGLTKPVGPGAARNFIWDYSIKQGHKWHWVMDDNIKGFYRLNNNLKIPVLDGAFFKIMEDFVDRYLNIGMAGPNYHMFATRKQKHPPIIMNTRIYSCNLIRNDIPYRWRGRYNEDTDLSLRMLKDGWCTVQFNACLQLKINTQKVKGGNTEAFYSKEGTYPKSRMLVDLHPDITKLVYKFGRIHHKVDYTGFKKLKLIRKKNLKLENRVNNYGLKLGENPYKKQ